MSGVGAWSFGFYKKGMPVPNPRVAAGILAFKHALADNGYGAGMVLSLAKFGSAMDRETRAFQAAEGIGVDGVIGSTTARALFRHYSFAAEGAGTVEIPDHLLQRLGGGESGHDPVAQGFADPSDEGWAQINLIFHPGVSQADAWKPSFAIPWAGRALATFFVNDAADWDGAVAAYNVGSFYARQWVEAGKPASGRVVDGFDIYTRATKYVASVKAQPI